MEEKYLYIVVRKKTWASDWKILKQYLVSQTKYGKIAVDAINMLENIVKLEMFPHTFTVYIETEYVDKVYRDIYYHHYASRHSVQSRNCIRLFFFNGEIDEPQNIPSDAEESLVGVCVVQPNGVLGRSYWNPRWFLTKGTYVRTGTYSFTILGKKLTIEAFPYMMQDHEATTCAEVTVLNLVDYYSKCYPEYRSILLSDIEQVEAKHSAQRLFPSKGMNYADVARSLSHVGLSPRIYASRFSSPEKYTTRRYIYHYTESGIPFGVAVESSKPSMLHSMICVGHGPARDNWIEDCSTNFLSWEKGERKLRSCWIADSADAYDSFVVMDDSDRPYRLVQFTSRSASWTFPQLTKNGEMRYAVQQLCIPLYKRVFLEVEGATEIFNSILTSRISIQSVLDRLSYDTEWKSIGKTKGEPLIVRTFLASSRTFLLHRIRDLDYIGAAMDERCLQVYQNLFCPRFVWVCELYTKKSFCLEAPRVIGEIVIDATARRMGVNGGFESVVLIHYPHFISYRCPESDWRALDENQIIMEKWCPYTQFRGNLTDYNEKAKWMEDKEKEASKC